MVVNHLDVVGLAGTYLVGGIDVASIDIATGRARFFKA